MGDFVGDEEFGLFAGEDDADAVFVVDVALEVEHSGGGGAVVGEVFSGGGSRKWSVEAPAIEAVRVLFWKPYWASAKPLRVL